MRRLRATLKRVAQDLQEERRRWALVGGFAVSARALPRTTRDIDVAVSVQDDADAEALVYALQHRGYTLLTSIEQTATGRLATVRFTGPRSTVVVDLLFASSGIEPEVAARAGLVEVLRHLSIPVAQISDLIAMKLLSRDDRRRPQDAADLRELLREASVEEISAARAALALITVRGFARGKDLAAELQRALGDLARGDA